jgi:CO dehydrogenase nickel-insertion accessory protein CooC1
MGFAESYGLKIFGIVPFDSAVSEAEMHGETPLKNKDSAAMHAIRELCEKLME